MRGVRHALVASLLAAASGCQRSAPAPRAPAPVTAVLGCTAGRGIEIAPAETAPGAAADGGEADSDTIVPCKAGSPEHDAATKLLSDLGDKVRDLGDDADPARVAAQLDALLETSCFALSAGESYDGAPFASAVELKAWWDGGGETWVSHYLTLDADRTSVVPPTVLRALTTSTRPSKGRGAGPGPLAPLLCSASDALSGDPAKGCGHETIGWAKRADRDLSRRALGSRAPGDGSTEESCAKAAMALGADERYASYRGCLDDVLPRREALPIGRFKAPTDGWLVSTGRRRRSTCVQVRAYDLATGAAYVAEECTPRQRYSSGVSFPGATSVVSVASGRVPLANLREAAWMLLFAQVAQSRVRTDASSFAIPAEIAIRRPLGGYGSTGGSSHCGGTAEIRQWSWMREKNGVLVGQASGSLRWPSAFTDAEDHAVELLELAEDALELGCTPAPLPARIPWAAPGPAIDPHKSAAAFEDPALEGVRRALAPSGVRRIACARP